MADEQLPALQVAQDRLLRRRAGNTVCSWLQRYLQSGLAGLLGQKGRGKRQLFSPRHSAESAAREVGEVVHRSPVLRGLDRHGWTLAGLRQVIPWMGGDQQAPAPLPARLQARIGPCPFPDLAYNQTMAANVMAWEEARHAPGEVIFLYEDEFTAYLRPLVGLSYRERSERGQKASGANADTVRLAGCVDAMTGWLV